MVAERPSTPRDIFRSVADIHDLFIAAGIEPGLRESREQFAREHEWLRSRIKALDLRRARLERLGVVIVGTILTVCVTAAVGLLFAHFGIGKP